MFIGNILRVPSSSEAGKVDARPDRGPVVGLPRNLWLYWYFISSRGELFETISPEDVFLSRVSPTTPFGDGRWNAIQL
jgi:hypothetical protein